MEEDAAGILNRRRQSERVNKGSRVNVRGEFEAVIGVSTVTLPGRTQAHTRDVEPSDRRESPKPKPDLDDRHHAGQLIRKCSRHACGCSQASLGHESDSKSIMELGGVSRMTRSVTDSSEKIDIQSHFFEAERIGTI
jgi:hypothetical protein